MRVIKKNGRLRFIHKDDLYQFLKIFFKSDVKKKSLKQELIRVAEELLTPDTLDLFTDHLPGFGLIKKDIRSLGMSEHRYRKLKTKNKFTMINTWFVSTDFGHLDIPIFSINSVFSAFNEESL